MPGVTNKVKVNGNYAFVADDLPGLVVVDVTNFRSPTVVASVASSTEAMDVCLDSTGHYAYVADATGGLKVVDISTPTSARSSWGTSTPAPRTPSRSPSPRLSRQARRSSTFWCRI